jgi:hypothetical protein
VSDGVPVPAWLTSLSAANINDFRAFWKPRLRTSDDEDQYWDWEQKQRIYLLDDESLYEGYAIECEQMTQGLMLLKIRGYRSQVEPNRPIMYVHSLATAPWNRIAAPDPNGFRAVGRVLLKFAQFRSEELGYGGLVGLHALLSAEEFYRKMGMWDGSADAKKENLVYFEWYRRRPSLLEEMGIELESDD